MKVATFNVENLDESDGFPALRDRIRVLRPQLTRLGADILCLQEVHGQERLGRPRDILALKELIATTGYETYEIAVTKTSAGEVYDQRNLVILSRYPIVEQKQYRNTFVDTIRYRTVSAIPNQEEAKEIQWERPILHVTVQHDVGLIHVINIHLKSRVPTPIPGQREGYGFKTVNGWAEGYFISSMKRVGQALEVRCLIDEILDGDPAAKIIVCGDFNAEPGEVPVEAIVGRVENTANPALGWRQFVPCSNSIPLEARYTHLHEGKGNLLDHVIISGSLLGYYRGAEIHNELLHDESIAFADDKKYPESDHAPFSALFSC
ncbi:MAG: endonuclease/exonuclease/phosphatase family protein [Desulfobulbaceae bacterium]|nr:endonuclease/exonuclease/phosphatase family protein [Desulfobulbaceae bacterium]